MSTEPADFSRPQSLAEFGRNLQDFLHTLRAFSTRERVGATIVDRPPLLADHFGDGDVADAYLAAYAELISGRLKVVAPAWAFAPERIRREPWFASLDFCSQNDAVRFARRSLGEGWEAGAHPRTAPFPPGDPSVVI